MTAEQAVVADWCWEEIPELTREDKDRIAMVPQSERTALYLQIIHKKYIEAADAQAAAAQAAKNLRIEPLMRITLELVEAAPHTPTMVRYRQWQWSSWSSGVLSFVSTFNQGVLSFVSFVDILSASYT